MNFKVLYAKTKVPVYLKALNEKDAIEFCSDGKHEFVGRVRGRLPRSIIHNCLCTDNWFNKNF